MEGTVTKNWEMKAKNMKLTLTLLTALLFLGGVLSSPVNAQVPGEIAALVK